MAKRYRPLSVTKLLKYGFAIMVGARLPHNLSSTSTAAPTVHSQALTHLIQMRKFLTKAKEVFTIFMEGPQYGQSNSIFGLTKLPTDFWANKKNPNF